MSAIESSSYTGMQPPTDINPLRRKLFGELTRLHDHLSASGLTDHITSEVLVWTARFRGVLQRSDDEKGVLIAFADEMRLLLQDPISGKPVKYLSRNGYSYSRESILMLAEKNISMVWERHPLIAFIQEWLGNVERDTNPSQWFPSRDHSIEALANQAIHENGLLFDCLEEDNALREECLAVRLSAVEQKDLLMASSLAKQIEEIDAEIDRLKEENAALKKEIAGVGVDVEKFKSAERDLEIAILEVKEKRKKKKREALLEMVGMISLCAGMTFCAGGVVSIAADKGGGIMVTI